MKKFFSDFKSFATKGNVIDMAVGVIIGAAFGKIVSSLVNDIVMPCVGLIVGNVNFTDLKVVLSPEVLNEAGEVVTAASTLNYGTFIQNIVDFLIIALSIFIVIRTIAKAKEKAEKLSKKKEEAVPPAPAPEPKPSAEELLLTEIRDLLKNNK